uniref:Uncharacterized protein n=1 Tax=Romanomermis culicivorax TaxID=13658 RepID=A0A915KX23_ROMCU
MLTVIGFFVIPEISDSEWASFASNIVWLSFSGLNSVIYLCFNSTLRRKALKMFSCQTKTTVEMITRSNQQNQPELMLRNVRPNSMNKTD